MTDGTDSDKGRAVDPADAFSLLGDETRLEIVAALQDASPDTPVQFSTLYDRVDLRDTAQFNYHLKRLRPQFVSRSDDGYDLTEAGRRIARAIAAGIYTDAPRIEPFEIDGRCYACDDDALWASYEDERFVIDCRGCGELVLKVSVPPSVVYGRDPEDFLEAVDDWSRLQVEQARRGVCPDCGGAVDPSVTERVHETIPFDAVARFDCTVCGRRVMTSFGGLAYRHPAVRAFHRRRGELLEERPYWEVGQYVAGDGVRIRSRDPWRIRVSFFATGDACRVEIDGDLEVVRTEVVPDGAPADD